MSRTAALSGSETASITTVAGSGTVTINGTTTGGFFVGQSMISPNITGTIQSAPNLGSGSSANYQIVVSSTASSGTTETGSFSSALYDNVHLSTIAQADFAAIYQNAIQSYPNYIIPTPYKDNPTTFALVQFVASGTAWSTDPDLQATLQPGAIYSFDFMAYTQPNSGTESYQVVSSGSLICNIVPYHSGAYQTPNSNGAVTPITTLNTGSIPNGSGTTIELKGVLINTGTTSCVVSLQVSNSGTGSEFVSIPAHCNLQRLK